MEAEDDRINIFHKYIIQYCTDILINLPPKNPFRVWSTSISGISKIIFY